MRTRSGLFWDMGMVSLVGSLISYMEGDPMVRTPHNVFFYALGYGGC